ncbi:MAG: hypothetical protein LH609_17315 [Rudanella sp.]|nr:hypothetical protein [Rudanella sp.]
MQRQLIHPVILLFGLTLLLSSCWNEPNFDDTPKITFAGLNIFRKLPAKGGVGGGERDSVIIALDFTDGNGDLGVNSPRNKADSLAYYTMFKVWGNYQIKVLRLVNNKYEELPLPENNVLVFPRLTKEGTKGAIEGTLEFRPIFFYGRTTKVTPVKFQIKIRDRNLLESNVIETDTVHVPLFGQ